MPSPDLDAARREAEEALARLEPVVVEAEHRVYRSQIRADMVKWEKVRAVGSAAVAALRSLLAATAPAPPPSDAVREAAEDLLSDYVGVEDMLTAETAKKVHRLRAALDVQGGGR